MNELPSPDARPAYVGSDISHMVDGPHFAVRLGVPQTDPGIAYLALLNRLPNRDERVRAAERGMAATCAEIARSEEHLAHLKLHAPYSYLLAGSPSADAAHGAGTISSDVVAVVGSDGQLLLHGDSNNYVPQFQGEFPLPGDWLDDWRAVVARPRERAVAAGVKLAQVIVPEKMAITPAAYPLDLLIRGPRPIELLLAACPGLDYPIDGFRASAEPGFLVTDSHLSPAGGQIMFNAACRQLDLVPPAPGEEDCCESLVLGDLGFRLDPLIIETATFPKPAAAIRITDENLPAIIASGAHLGSYRVTENSRAPFAERLLVFGDSFSLPMAPGLPGGFGDRLARAFKTVHFCWAPFSWDDKLVAEVQPDVIIQEMGERGIHRVPSVTVDFASLAAAALASDAPPAPDQLRERQPVGKLISRFGHRRRSADRAD